MIARLRNYFGLKYFADNKFTKGRVSDIYAVAVFY